MNIEETNMMIIGGKNTDLQRLTGQLKLWEYGDFNETRAKKLSSLPGLVSPDYRYIILVSVHNHIVVEFALT